MSKLQIGDDVEVISVDHFSLREQELFNLKIGDNGEIIGFHKRYEVFAIVENHKFKNSKAGDGKLYIPKSHLIKIGESQMQYEESNCYKLKQAIKKTGISSEKLSLATTKGKTKYHFYSYTKKSRLTDRGDISDARLNKLLTDLRHAEREVLGIGAKTVDCIKSSHDTEMSIDIEEYKNWCEELEKNNGKPTLSRNHDDHVDAISFGLIETDFKEKPKSNKPLFIGAAAVIFIALILFVLNNYLQVV